MSGQYRIKNLINSYNKGQISLYLKFLSRLRYFYNYIKSGKFQILQFVEKEEEEKKGLIILEYSFHMEISFGI